MAPIWWLGHAHLRPRGHAVGDYAAPPSPNTTYRGVTKPRFLPPSLHAVSTALGRPPLIGAVIGRIQPSYAGARTDHRRAWWIVRSIAQSLHAPGGDSKVLHCLGGRDPLPPRPSASVTFLSASLARSFIISPSVADGRPPDPTVTYFSHDRCLSHGSRYTAHQSDGGLHESASKGETG